MATSNSQTLDREHPPSGLRMTEEEFVAWCARADVKKVEWVNGEVVMMAPISGEHDDIQWWLRSLLAFYVRRKDLGKLRGPEFTCRMTGPGIGTIRRDPDVMFIAKQRLELLQPNHFEGAPDLAIEIVSPESEARDWREKYLEYEAAGVREYWIVDPLSKRVEAYSLKEGKFQVMAEKDEKIQSSVVAGWYLKPEWLWHEELPDVLEILAELGVK